MIKIWLILIFSNAACMGYCSKCYREILKHEQKQAAEDSTKNIDADQLKRNGTIDITELDQTCDNQKEYVPNISISTVSDISTSVSTSYNKSTLDNILDKSIVKDNNLKKFETSLKKTSVKCFTCHKKIGLTGFTCKCGNIFCGTHRYAEAHDCTYDHKSAERTVLERDNPLIQGNKLQRL